MKIRRTLVTALAPLVIGCGGSVVSGRGDAAPDVIDRVDAVVPPDAVTPDVVSPDAPRPDVVVVRDVPVVDTRVPRCGDGVLDPGESCDDNNNRGGDGCSAMCRFEARCGDRHVDMGEVCDDGNNASGDGCRSDCLSNETCGNRIVDTARGEVCDGTPGCAADCRSIVSCGNGRVESGEQCDDGNTTRWDGCGPDCRTEQAVVLNRLSIAPESNTIGCDFSGDRVPDNAFAAALGPALGILNSLVTNQISNGQVLIQLGFLNLTDARGQNLPDTRVGWLIGADADAMLTNNATAGNPEFVQVTSLNAMTLLPQASFQSRVTGGALAGGPEDITLDFGSGTPLGAFSFGVRRARITGTVQADMTRIVAIHNGVICGAIPAHDLAGIQNPAGLIPGGGGGGMMSRSSFLELLVGGQRIIAFNIGPQQPDIDLDGDGLERYEATMGSAGLGGGGTPPQITACIDGDGTRIPGRECADDPRMADGFSSAFQYDSTWITLRGVTGGSTTVPVDAGVAPVADAGR